MRGRLLAAVAFFGLLGLIVVSLQYSSAGLLSFSSSGQNIAATAEPFGAEEVKPAECEGMSLDDPIVSGGGILGDLGDHDGLIIGNDSGNEVDAKNGNDCVVGNAGDDDIDGGSGTDVCLGGSGDDNLSNCETCYGGGGSDTDLTGSCTFTSSVEFP